MFVVVLGDYVLMTHLSTHRQVERDARSKSTHTHAHTYNGSAVGVEVCACGNITFQCLEVFCLLRVEWAWHKHGNKLVVYSEVVGKRCWWERDVV